MYNKTQLNPDASFERHVYHRDQFAHYLRWTHVLKIAKIHMNVLDFGCGSGNLAEVFYRNKFKCNRYLGLDIRSQMIQKNADKFKSVPWIKFEQSDLCHDINNNIKSVQWDVICSFEVIEHIGKENADVFLKNIHDIASDKTVILLSTPNYDEKVGAANNHIIDGKVGEFYHKELQELLEKYFVIDKKYGTFASQRDYKLLMNDWQQKFYDYAIEYFDSNILSNLMAPMFPEQSRNCMWVLRKK